jgi:hypothetical protein
VTIPNRSEAHESNGINRHSDMLVLFGGGVLSGALGLGGAVLFGSWADTGSGVGPTAASLNEAFSNLLGAAIGLALGSALVASPSGSAADLSAGWSRV